MYYAGAKWGRDANPDKFMKECGYHTSSNLIKEIIALHGLDIFTIRKIKKFETSDQAHYYETRFLQKINAKKHPKFYNTHNNDGMMDYNKNKMVLMDLYGVEFHSQREDVKRKTIDTNLSRRGVFYSFQCEEVKEKSKKTILHKYGETHYNKTEESKKNLSDNNPYKGKDGFFKGKTHTEESRLLIGDASRGRIKSKETKEKLSVANKGKKLSEEVKRKISSHNKKRVDEGKHVFSKISAVDKEGNCVFVEKDIFYEEKKKPYSERLFVGITSKEGKRRREINTR
jgi:hypothetical protein